MWRPHRSLGLWDLFWMHKTYCLAARFCGFQREWETKHIINRIFVGILSGESAHHRRLQGIEIKYFRNFMAYYCRLTPNCWVGRGGRGGGTLTTGGSLPFCFLRRFSSCLQKSRNHWFSVHHSWQTICMNNYQYCSWCWSPDNSVY